jgi:hypothetical protein
MELSWAATMRVPFQLENFQPFSFSVGGVTYAYPETTRLAFKPNLEANIEESVVQTRDGKKIWLTVVGDEDEASPYGIQRGWYVAQALPEDSAAFLVKAFAGWSADLR